MQLSSVYLLFITFSLAALTQILLGPEISAILLAQQVAQEVLSQEIAQEVAEVYFEIAQEVAQYPNPDLDPDISPESSRNLEGKLGWKASFISFLFAVGSKLLSKTINLMIISLLKAVLDSIADETNTLVLDPCRILRLLYLKNMTGVTIMILLYYLGKIFRIF